ncbi:hypothetical protein GCM10022295_90560 [Streptomyces osmaniensis]|uniref:Uncharacterized protein n=1 Tax=Streptomyces osmaniensis TaxID=593134 RepID=A0ABP6Z2U9_9ACTN
MIESAQNDTELKLHELSHALIGELEGLIGSCKTTGDLKTVLGAVSLMDTFLARAIAVSIVSFAHGGTLPPPGGDPVSVQVKAAAVLDKIPQSWEWTGPLRNLLAVQGVSSHAAAGAHGALADTASVSLKDIYAALEEMLGE